MSQDSEELVNILETRNQGMIATAKSLLEGAGIEYATNNEFSQDAWIGGMANGAQIWVKPEDADSARLILSQLEETSETSEVEPPQEYEPTETAVETPADLSRIPAPQPEQPFIVRFLWLVGMLLIPLILVILYIYSPKR